MLPIKVVLLLLAISSASLAQQAPAIYYSVPAADAPELAARGHYAVGVRTVDLLHHDQVDILHFDKSTGKAPLYDRPLKVEIWYPAIIPAGQQEQTTYQMPVPGGRGLAGVNTLSIADRALRDAPPVAGETLPPPHRFARVSRISLFHELHHREPCIERLCRGRH